MDASRARALRLCALLVVCALLPLGGCTGSDSGSDSPGSLQSDYQKVIKNVLPSVVQIRSGAAVGSGVVYDGKGHIVTNAHVVRNAKTFEVTTAHSGVEHTARLVSSYPQQDLAVIKLDKVPKGLKAAAFADSAKVAVGQIVLAMGSPFGLSSSVTQGIVSATGRTVSEQPVDQAPGVTIVNMVQTSAAINPGNSGGALADLNSQVIGIPALGAVDPVLGGGAAPGIGFAIPASLVRSIADQIIRDGKVTESGRAALGITGRTVVDDSYEPAGVAVVDVRSGGAADEAGLEAGDVITGLGDTRITTVASLATALAGDKPGRKTTVTYVRDGNPKTVDIALGEQR